jgi:hypothetical protein
LPARPDSHNQPEKKIDIGCIHIERDVEAEEQIDQNPIQSNSRL